MNFDHTIHIIINAGATNNANKFNIILYLAVNIISRFFITLKDLATGGVPKRADKAFSISNRKARSLVEVAFKLFRPLVIFKETACEANLSNRLGVCVYGLRLKRRPLAGGHNSAMID